MYLYLYLTFEDPAMHKEKRERCIERTITTENDLALYKNIQDWQRFIFSLFFNRSLIFFEYKI